MPDYVTYTLFALIAVGWIFLLFRFFQAAVYFQARFHKRLHALHAEAQREEAEQAKSA